MNTATLQIERDGAVARVWLNRPEVRNAFNEELIAELRQTFESLAGDPSLRAIVLGSRGKAFCAGADLSWMKTMSIRSVPSRWRLSSMERNTPSRE